MLHFMISQLFGVLRFLNCEIKVAKKKSLHLDLNVLAKCMVESVDCIEEVVNANYKR